MNKFKRFAQFLVFYVLLVILWGAWVRISHSGDGCGTSWPLCKGEVLPENINTKTFTEYFHRFKSGLFGILVLIQFFWSRRVFPARHLARKFATLSLIFTISEALLGAKLVLSGLVGDNDSPYRAAVMAAHLLNSLALVAFIALTAEFASKMDWNRRSLAPWTNWKHKRLSPLNLSLAIIGCFFLLGISGAVAALSTTLFPSESLLSGLATDLSPNAHYLLRLRGAHPLFGICLGSLIAGFAYLCFLREESASLFKTRSLMVAIMTTLAILVGMITLLSLSPVYLKLIHLTMTYGLWILLIQWLRTWRWN